MFIKEFITNPFSTGAIASSSPELTELITDTAELGKHKTIVEIGSGTGVFTERIYMKKDQNSKFFVIELNPSFAKATKNRCPHIDVFTDSASNINKYLYNMGLAGCDCIVSSLPWTTLNNNIQNDILDSIYKSLMPGGMFLTYVYIYSQFLPTGIMFKSKLINKFGNLNKTKTIWKNIPPAFVYSATK